MGGRLLEFYIALSLLLLYCPGAETQGTIHHDKIKKARQGGAKQRGEGPSKRAPNLDIGNLKNQSIAYKEWFASLGPEDYTQAHW